MSRSEHRAGDHRARLVLVKDGGLYEGRCTCGWAGIRVYDEADAITDLVGHQAEVARNG